MKESALDRAAKAAGISLSYTNAKGESEATGDETIKALLAVMSHPQKPTDAPLPPVQVFCGGDARLLNPEGRGIYQWRLISEKGRIFEGELQAGQPFMLPAPLGHGYHWLTLAKNKRQWRTRIILAPRRCWQPEALRKGEKCWGALVQLYTLRSADNWGIGDFGDLQQLLEQVAKQGGDFVGLNPLHALYPATPEFASPYSPSSRRWLNIIYINVAQLADFQQSQAAQKWWTSVKTQRALEKARKTEFVDYAAVMALKLPALRYAWKQFRQRSADDAQQLAYAAFIRDGGDSLRYQAAYDGLQAERCAADAAEWGWPAWPEAWRNSQLPAVQHWCQTHQDEIAFWQWLQWLAQTQFAQCWTRSQALHMRVGLYRDLAVGVAEGSAETWHDPELYRLQASVGAPPDRLGPLGQNWGLPPMDPHVMRERGYQPFTEMLRANMRDCGALRIDHVMALLRLWWVPKGETADKGAYVSYPVQDLLAILALESQRHRCMVIGEDLGTVPKEIVGLLRASGIFSWKVMWFEQQRDGRYRLPDDYPQQSIASASTHDLPTLSGFWNAEDFVLGEKLNLYPGKALLASLYAQRAKQKQALLDALHLAGAMPARGAKQAADLTMTPGLKLAMHKFLAKTHSALLGLQPEDWIGMSAPVNVPGTIDQYPNWRRKLTQPLDELFSDREVKKLLRIVSETRREK